MIIGKHLIAGEWVDGERVFQSDPAHGPAHEFAVGSEAHVDEACTQAEEAFWSYSALSIDAHAAFLDKIADEIEACAPFAHHGIVVPIIVDERMRINNGVLRFDIARELGLHVGSQTHGSKA